METETTTQEREGELKTSVAEVSRTEISTKEGRPAAEESMNVFRVIETGEEIKVPASVGVPEGKGSLEYLRTE